MDPFLPFNGSCMVWSVFRYVYWRETRNKSIQWMKITQIVRNRVPPTLPNLPDEKYSVHPPKNYLVPPTCIWREKNMCALQNIFFSKNCVPSSQKPMEVFDRYWMLQRLYLIHILRSFFWKWFDVIHVFNCMYINCFLLRGLKNECLFHNKFLSDGRQKSSTKKNTFFACFFI